MRTLYWLILASLGIICCASLVVGQDDSALFPDPVATVNGQPISREVFYRRLLQTAGQQVLKQLVEEELVRQEAAKRKITISEDELNERLATDEAAGVAQRRYSEGRYVAWLKLRRGVLELDMLKERLVSDQVSVADEEVEEAYKRSRDSYPITVPEGRRVSFILYAKDKEDQAHKDRGILQRNPEKFGELARAHSISPTKERGGEHPDYVRLGPDPGADERAIFGLAKVGDISQVVTTTEGFFIIRLDDIQPQKRYEYEEVKDTLRELIRRQRIGGAYREWLGVAMQKAKVKLNFVEDSVEGDGPG